MSGEVERSPTSIPVPTIGELGWLLRFGPEPDGNRPLRALLVDQLQSSLFFYWFGALPRKTISLYRCALEMLIHETQYDKCERNNSPTPRGRPVSIHNIGRRFVQRNSFLATGTRTNEARSVLKKERSFRINSYLAASNLRLWSRIFRLSGINLLGFMQRIKCGKTKLFNPQNS